MDEWRAPTGAVGVFGQQLPEPGRSDLQQP
jgi:hypothetical protein